MSRSAGRLIGYAIDGDGASGLTTSGGTVVSANNVPVGNHRIRVEAKIGSAANNSASGITILTIKRDSTVICTTSFGPAANVAYPATPWTVDNPGAGTYDFHLTAQAYVGGTVTVGGTVELAIYSA